MKKFKISIQQITLAGIMLGTITVTKFIDRVMPKTPLGASWIEIYMIMGVFLVLTLPMVISSLVLVSAPFLWLELGLTWQANPLSFFLDYSIPLLALLIVYWIKLIKFKKDTFILKGSLIIVLILVAFSIKWASHTLSGVLSYGTSLGQSAILNSPYVFATFGITIAFTIFMLPKLSAFQLVVNQKGMRW